MADAQCVIPNLPCDFLDFLHHFGNPEVHSDFLWTTTVALVKEPTATAAMEETGAFTAPPTPESVNTAFMAAMDQTDKAPHDSELRTLGRQGVARTTGTASMLRQWGYIETYPLAAAQGPAAPCRRRVYHLGVTQRKYVLAPEAAREAAVRKLLAARSAVETTWSGLQDDTDVMSIMAACRKAFRDAAEAAPTMFPKHDTGYIATFVGRKVVLARLAGGLSVDWGGISRLDLEELSCDQSGSLKACDETWSAADISNFIFGRPDWGMFVSVFACLWHEAVAVKGTSRQALLKDIENNLWTFLQSYEEHDLLQVHPDDYPAAPATKLPDPFWFLLQGSI